MPPNLELILLTNNMDEKYIYIFLSNQYANLKKYSSILDPDWSS